MHPNPLARASSPARPAWRAFVAACVAVVFAGHVIAQAPAVDGGAPPPMPAEELDKLVAPIALYPDDLVAIILPAATNPLQLVQADRFLDKRKADPKLPVDDKWDDSVKALLNYPDVVKTMSGDLDWTAALGEAVVADQGAVLEAIQVFRRKTQAVGNLKIGRQAGRRGREGSHQDRPGQSGGDLRAAVQPDDDRGGRRLSVGLLADAVPGLLLPVPARCRLCHRAHLGRGDRRGVERRPLEHQLGRRRHQHQSQHEHQHRQHQPRRAVRRRGRPRAAAPRGNRTSDRGRSATRSAGRRRRRAWAIRAPAGRAARARVARRRNRPAAALAAARGRARRQAIAPVRRAHRSAQVRSARRRATVSAVRAPAGAVPRRAVP